VEVSELHGVLVAVAVTKAAANLPRRKDAPSRAAAATQGKKIEKPKSKERAAA
jgi:hypothetical protein